MSTIQVPSIGLPGTVVDAADINNAFTAFETTINQTNLRNDSIHTYHMSTPAIQQQAGYTENTDSALTTYTGFLWQAVTHGTNPINTGLILLPNNSYLTVHFHQYLAEITVGIPDLDRFTSFKLEWNLGAGYVDIPDAQMWVVYCYQQNSIKLLDQSLTHNILGSWTYQNTSGSTLAILGIRLIVRPSDSIPGDSCDLGEGNISHIIQTR